MALIISGVDTKFDFGTKCKGPRIALESVLTSQARVAVRRIHSISPRAVDSLIPDQMRVSFISYSSYLMADWKDP
jgi:hypothetical protein